MDEALKAFSRPPYILDSLTNSALRRLAEQASTSYSLMMERLSPTLKAALSTPDLTGKLMTLPDLSRLVHSDSILRFAESEEKYLKDVAKIQEALGDGIGVALASHRAQWERLAAGLPDMSSVLKSYSMPDMAWMRELDRAALSLSFDHLTIAYEAVRASPFLSELPAFGEFRMHDVEMHAQIQVLDFYSVPPQERRDSEPTDDESPLIASAEELLGRVSTRLQRRLVAARQALASNNPERTQHCAVSLRRLILTLIDILGPTDAARAWAAKLGRTDLFQNGKVTRRVRLLYIVGWQGEGDVFSDFLERTVNSLLANLDVLNEELHGEEATDQMAVVLGGGRDRVVLLAMAAGIETIITAARYRRES